MSMKVCTKCTHVSEFNFSKGKFQWMEEVLNLSVNKLPFYLYYLIALHSLYFFFLIKLMCHQFMLFVFILWYEHRPHFHCTAKQLIKQKFAEMLSGNQSESVFVRVLSRVGHSQIEL